MAVIRPTSIVQIGRRSFGCLKHHCQRVARSPVLGSHTAQDPRTERILNESHQQVSGVSDTATCRRSQSCRQRRKPSRIPEPLSVAVRLRSIRGLGCVRRSTCRLGTSTSTPPSTSPMAAMAPNLRAGSANRSPRRSKAPLERPRAAVGVKGVGLRGPNHRN